MIDLSKSSCIELTKYLIEKGADPNKSDYSGNRPLHELARYQSNRSYNYFYNHQFKKDEEEAEKRAKAA